MTRFQGFLELLPFEYSNPDRQEVLDAAVYTELKDAPVIAAARKVHLDFLVSLDRRHLVWQKGVEEASGISIILPAELLDHLKQGEKSSD